MPQEQFLEVVSPEEARARWHGALRFAPPGEEEVPLGEALGRVLSAPVVAPGDLPPFDRSNLDGYAVRSEDTHGASERSPALLHLAAQSVVPGEAPRVALEPGWAVPIATGGMLPRGADAVVMVEDAEEVADARVRIVRPVPPGAGIAQAGSDIARGERALARGERLTARETGTLAALGIASVRCARRPRVAVLSTGDEVVEPGQPLEPGQVHDANGTLLADAVRELGAEPVLLGRVGDDEARIGALLARALEEHDAVLLSGGTSKGAGDLSFRVAGRFARVVVHGVALKPGKPLCLAEYRGKPLAVLPGFPTSAIFTFHVFVAPVLRRLLGVGEVERATVRARLPRRLLSEAGRMEFVLVALLKGRSGLLAAPLGKGSGSVSAFGKADGFVEIPAAVERLDAGEEVEVSLLARGIAPADLVLVGSHCTGLDILQDAVASRGLSTRAFAVGSRAGLEAAAEGACDAAPVHLFDPPSGRYNEPFLRAGLRLLPGYGRKQGLAFRPDASRGFLSGSAVEALRRAAADAGLRVAGRNAASGTHALLEHLLGPDMRPPGWSAGYRSHTAVAAAVAQGRADYGVCLESAARGAGLGWRALKDERLDFLVPVERWDEPGARALREALADPATRNALQEAGFTP